MLSRKGHWKLILVTLILLIFASLYGFIYQESVKQPSEGWSNAVEVNAYESNVDLSNPNLKNTFATQGSNGEIINVSLNGSEIVVHSINTQGQITSEKQFKLDYQIRQINGAYSNGKLKLVVQDASESFIQYLDVDLESQEIVKLSEHNTENMSAKLNASYSTLYNNETIKVVTAKTLNTINLEKQGRLLKAETFIHQDYIYLVGVLNDKGSIKMSELYQIPRGQSSHSTLDLKMDSLETMTAQSTVKPVNVELIRRNGQFEAYITLLDTRHASNSIQLYTFDKIEGTNTKNVVNMNTYDGVPHMLKLGQGYKIIVGLADDNLGRTEVARGKKVYPNLYLVDDIVNGDFKQVTSTEVIGRTPSLMIINGSEYLIHNEFRNGKNIVYMSSNDPEFIKLSKNASKRDLIDVFYRTIVNYPALMFASIVPTVSILLPVMAIVLPFMMLKLSWVEQNKGKTMALILSFYSLSKFYVYANDIFDSYQSTKMLPNYLASSVGHWGVLLVISLMTIGIAMSRANAVKEKHESFIKSVAIYILLDVTLVNLFFLPYTII